VNCVRFLGITDIDKINRLTIPEYKLLLKGQELRIEDIDERQHWQAFLNFKVQGTNKNGTPRYRSFKAFYEEDKQQRSRQKKSNQYIDRLEEYYRLKGGKNG
jgi:hypothetical protein